MTQNRKVPPHNKEAEQAVLAAILIDDQALDKVVDKIRPEDFYIPGISIFTVVSSAFRRWGNLWMW